jgi:pantoate--beta-alanine ligase
MTKLITSISELRSHLRANRTTGLVPTMGALHTGHAARRECETVVVSIFINPLQFDRQDDLDRYPRTPQPDIDLCNTLGADFVFAPSAAEMYPSATSCTVEVGRIADHLCGKFRPGHFRGVATAVMKLLQIVQPHRAYFGEKDAQQLAVIRKLVADLNVPVTIVGVPTVRESDGLAISSRNRQLNSAERKSAIVLYEALRVAEQLICRGEHDVAAIRRAALDCVAANPGVRLEYLEIVDPEDMQPVSTISRRVLTAGAIWVGTTRLIDNVLCVPPQSKAA